MNASACECLLEACSQALSSSLDNEVVRVVHVALLCYLQGVVWPPRERTGKEHDSSLLQFTDSSHQ